MAFSKVTSHIRKQVIYISTGLLLSFPANGGGENAARVIMTLSKDLSPQFSFSSLAGSGDQSLKAPYFAPLQKKGSQRFRAQEDAVKKNQSAWDFSGTGLDADEIEEIFQEDGAPDSVIYYQNDRWTQILPEYDQGRPATGFTLYLADQKAVERTKEQRVQRMREASAKKLAANNIGLNGEMNAENSEDSQDTSLPEEAYLLHTFSRGLRDDRKQLISVRGDPRDKIYGPDYSVHLDEAGAIAATLSLGHAGEVILQVSDNGSVRDAEGFDFTLYENVFRLESGALWQEFAHVGVSMTGEPDDFVWFPCDPDRGVLIGCAGVVPTDAGGDQFDLAELGVSNIRFIKIRDWGKNKNKGANKEGFDLDAGRLHHAKISKD